MPPIAPIVFSPTSKAKLPLGYLVVCALVKFEKSYNGPAIKVQRQSDNAQQDINFINGLLDTATINSFGSGTTLRILTMYDQSGNGLDNTAVNATAPQLGFDTYTNSYYINHSAVAGSFFTLPSGVAINTRNCSLYMSVMGKLTTSQTFFDFPSGPLFRYGQSAFNKDFITDVSGVQHSNANTYVGGSVDFTAYGVRANGTNVRSNIDNLAKTTLLGSALTSNNTAGGTIGRSGSTISGFSNGWIIYNSVLSDSDDTLAITVLQQITNKTTTKNKLVISSGDSIAHGDGATSWLNSWFVKLYRAKNEPLLNFMNTAVAGSKITDINLSTQITGLLTQPPGSYLNSVLLPFTGTNDLVAGVSGATAFASYKSLVQNAKSGGIGKVISMNIMVRPSMTGAQETERQNYNAAWRADQTYADAYIDFDTFINSGDISADNTHPNDGGHLKISNNLLPILNSVL